MYQYFVEIHLKITKKKHENRYNLLWDVQIQ